MKNAAFFGEEPEKRAFDPIVADILRTLEKHTLPAWYIRQALSVALDFYRIGPEMETQFGRERFMAMNEDRN
jgi:hypothetical protein